MSDDFKFKVGDKVRSLAWDMDSWCEILCIAERTFFARDRGGSEGCYSKELIWQLYQEPKKTKLVSPAITNDRVENYWRMTNALWEDGEQNPMTGFKWPARVVLKNLRWTDKNRNTVDSGTHQLEGDLFFEVEES